MADTKTKIMTLSKRVPVYWIALIIGAVVLAWVIAEMIWTGITGDLVDAFDTVAGAVGTIAASSGAIITAVLALKNKLDDETPAAPDTEPTVTDGRDGFGQ